MFDSHYSNNEGYDRDVNDQRQYQNVMQQKVFSNESDVEDDVCNMVSSKEEVTLRKPSKEETDKITVSMVAQVQTRGIAQRGQKDKVTSIFIKGTKQKKGKLCQGAPQTLLGQELDY